jgi:opacity protein-like surface antigen
MFRFVPAATLAVALMPWAAAAQSTVFTVTTATADVHKSPSVGSPTIGQALRGRELAVTREVGDWVRVSWPSGPDGAGYVRRSLGSLSRPAGPVPAGVAAPSSSAAEPAAQSGVDVRSDIAAVHRSSLPVQHKAPAYRLPSHVIGLGGLMNGSELGFGASGRAWTTSRLGVQVELSRFSRTDALTLGRVNSIVFAPSVIYSVRSLVRDSFWLRPYFGGGAKLSRSTHSIDAVPESLSENRTSWQVLGGSELTLPNAPRFALSADVRYDSSDEPFAGFEFGGLGFAIAGHWYVK